MLIGFAAAALLVVALELFLSKGFDILHICQVLFPALTVVFLLPSLFGQQYTTLLVAFLMFGFEVVNLPLIITCAVYTIRNGLPSSPLHALCIGPVLLSMAVGSGLAELLGPALSDDLAHWTNVILLCVVLLSVALILVTRGKGQALASMTDAELLNRGTTLRRGRARWPARRLLDRKRHSPHRKRATLFGCCRQRRSRPGAQRRPLRATAPHPQLP